MQEAGKQLGISPVIGERFYQRMIMIGRQAVAGGVRYMDAVIPQQPEHIDIAVKIYIHGFLRSPQGQLEGRFPAEGI